MFECTFKYPDELKNTTAACNGVDGFMGRCEGVRKWAFGVQHLQGKNIAGTDNFSETTSKGLFIFRGDKIFPEMQDVDDFVEYDWVQLNPTDPKDQAKIVAHFTAKEYDGMEVFYRKYCK